MHDLSAPKSSPRQAAGRADLERSHGTVLDGSQV